VKYFFDNCISYRLVDMLVALEVDAVALRKEFPEAIEDPEFLGKLKDRDYVYITHDHRQKTREAEALAIQEAGITALWLGPFWSGKGFWECAKWLVSHWESIDRFASSAARGTCAEIKHNGRSLPFQLKVKKK
jgi:hypothetical protein